MKAKMILVSALLVLVTLSYIFHLNNNEVIWRGITFGIEPWTFAIVIVVETTLCILIKYTQLNEFFTILLTVVKFLAVLLAAQSLLVLPLATWLSWSISLFVFIGFPVILAIILMRIANDEEKYYLAFGESWYG